MAGCRPSQCQGEQQETVDARNLGMNAMKLGSGHPARLAVIRGPYGRLHMAMLSEDLRMYRYHSKVPFAHGPQTTLYFRTLVVWSKRLSHRGFQG